MNCFPKNHHLRCLTGFWIHFWRLPSKVLELVVLKISGQKGITQVYRNLSGVLGENLRVSDYFKNVKNENLRWKYLNYAKQTEFFLFPGAFNYYITRFCDRQFRFKEAMGLFGFGHIERHKILKENQDWYFLNRRFQAQSIIH